jgi:diguanylate cyclase (GGDEF)-like protein/PAS domain S-box-containing protein
LGLAWIVLSSIWVRGGAFVLDVELVKGSLFVLASGGVIHYLLRRDERRVELLRDDVELAKARLADDDSLIEAIERAVPSGIVTFDREGAVRSWSPSMTRLLGWTGPECIGRSLPGLGGADEIELLRSIGRVSSSGIPARRSIAVRRKDGTRGDLVCEFAALDRNEHFAADATVIAALTDVSEIEGLRREVVAVADRWRLGVEAVGEGVLDWDIAADHVTLSPRALALLDATDSGALRPEDLWRFVWPEDMPALRASGDRLLASHGTEQLTFRVRSRQHAFRWMRQTAVVALAPDGTPERVVAALRDETHAIFAEGTREAVTQMHEDLLAGVDFGSTSRSVCERLLAPFNLARAEVWSRSGDGRLSLLAQAGTELPAATGIGPRGAKAPPHDGPTARAARERLTIVAPILPLSHEGRSDDAGTGTAIAIPIRSTDRIVGVLSAVGSWSGDPDPRLLASLESIAGGLGAADAIADARERLILNDAAVASSANGIAILDAAGRVVQTNSACASMLRSDPNVLVGLHLESLMQADDDENESRHAPVTEALRRDFVVDHDGVTAHIHMTRSPIPGPDGTVAYTVAVLEDLSEQRRQEARIAHLARYDALTDLPNRQLFLEQARGAIARAERANQQVGILFLDLDHFKHINDSLGHAVGDSVLRATATRLSAQLRPGDVVARFGGDEFVVLLGSLRDSGEAGALAKRLLSVHEEPIAAGGILHHVGVSVGIALFPDDGRDLDDLLQHADLAMYRAKADGRQTMHFFHRQMDELAVRRGSIERALHSALAHDEFRVVYQPQLRLSDGALVGAEALIRWRSRELGDVPPGDFIPVAENLGIIRPVGVQVLSRAATQAHLWARDGVADLRIAVNLSMAQFRSNNLAQELAATVVAAGRDASRIELEITESMLAEDAERAERSLRTLHGSGFELAIDDFGTGYSSMFALQRYPLARLKIDRSFVKDIEHDANSATIVRATVDLAHALGISVLAEGVETEGQEHFLRDVGCDEAQGFRFARPLEVRDFASWARRFQARAPGDSLALPPLD